MKEEQAPPQAAERPWLEIHDEVLTSDALVAEVEKRVAARRAALGPINLIFPTFGHVSTCPEPPSDGTPHNPNLYYYLKQANRAAPSSVEPVLAPSPATSVPVLGRLWQLIRSEMHNLILFYVNRVVADQNQININMVSTLNELTRENQALHAEIDRLSAELHERRDE